MTITPERLAQGHRLLAYVNTALTSFQTEVDQGRLDQEHAINLIMHYLAVLALLPEAEFDAVIADPTMKSLPLPDASFSTIGQVAQSIGVRALRLAVGSGQTITTAIEFTSVIMTLRQAFRDDPTLLHPQGAPR